MWSPVTKNIPISSVEPADKPKFETQTHKKQETVRSDSLPFYLVCLFKSSA